MLRHLENSRATPPEALSRPSPRPTVVYSSSASRSRCLSRRRYCFADLCTLCDGVLSRSFTGALGLGTRTVSFRLLLLLTMPAWRESAGRDARSVGCETGSIRAG